jgi:thiol-disulfide isomerase/thioredoxin
MSVATAASTWCTAFEKDRDWFVLHDVPQPLSGKTFESGDGQACRFSDLAGKPLPVHFRGSWCPPCLEELPSINRLQGLLWNEGLLAVPLSRYSGDPDKAREIYRQLEIGFLPIFTGRPGGLAQEARVANVPVTLFVRSDGREIGRLFGSVEWASPGMLEQVRAGQLAYPVAPPSF